MKVRAAVYLRVSTMEQAENGWSIDGQLDDIRKHCLANEYRVVRIYKDAGFSGADLERPGLMKLLDHASAGLFDVVVFWKYDRLSRDNVDFPALLHFINSQGVNTVSVTEPSPNDGSPYNEFIIGILGLVSALERRVITMRTRMGVKKRLEAGFYKGSHPPYGYNYNEDTGHLEMHPVEGKVVKLMFDKYLELGTLNQLCRFLKEGGYPTKNGGPWGISSIKRILGNKVYLGLYIYKDIITEHRDLRLVEDCTFEKVQERLKERASLSPMIAHNAKAAINARGLTPMDIGSDEAEGYLQRKAEMPPCPRCGEQLRVAKWGFRNSPTVGRLQVYCCRDCNYEFSEFPELPPREDVKACPHCRSVYHVRKEGAAKEKSSGQRYQKYYCGSCVRWFR